MYIFELHRGALNKRLSVVCNVGTKVGSLSPTAPLTPNGIIRKGLIKLLKKTGEVQAYYVDVIT